jgi:hypothetical protein
MASLSSTLACTLPPAHAQTWTVYNDVQYGFVNQETADFYILNRGINPAIVLIHGEGSQAGDKS